MTFLHCDNYATCDSSIRKLDDDHQTEQHARARGWHIYAGKSLEGITYLQVHLCEKCMRNRRPRPVEVLEGQEELFHLEVVIEPPARETR